jgi:hypothetical protein
MNKVQSRSRTMNGASQQTLNYWSELRTKSVKKYQQKQRGASKEIKTKKTVDSQHQDDPDETLTKRLQPVYRILRADFLQHNRLCLARLSGCTYYATQVHHMYKRTGWWLIVMKFFYPICSRCHRAATKDSRNAINSGISISRHAQVELDFNKHTIQVLSKFNISPPK